MMSVYLYGRHWTWRLFCLVFHLINDVIKIVTNVLMIWLQLRDIDNWTPSIWRNDHSNRLNHNLDSWLQVNLNQINGYLHYYWWSEYLKHSDWILYECYRLATSVSWEMLKEIPAVRNSEDSEAYWSVAVNQRSERRCLSDKASSIQLEQVLLKHFGWAATKSRSRVMAEGKSCARLLQIESSKLKWTIFSYPI